MGGLVRTALRLTALRALKGKTFAGDRVEDSSIVPMTEAIAENPKPVVVIYTDDDDHPISGLDLLTPAEGAGNCSMVFLIAIAGATALDAGDWEIQFSATDAASELTLDLIENDIKHALLDPRDPWADLWRVVASRGSRWRSQRGATEEKGARYAARQLILDLDPLADPLPGGEPIGFWADLVAAIAADPDLDFAALAPIMTRAIRGASTLADRERAQVALGLTKWAAYTTGLEPAPVDYTQTPGEALPPVVEIEIDAEIAIDERVTQ